MRIYFTKLILINGGVSMEKLYENLMKFLRKEDKENSFKLCINALENDISVPELYESILAPALNSIIEEYDLDMESLIWKEHVRSGIIRTIVESAYPYVLKERDKLGYKNKGSVIVICPQFEDHELGARMVSDFFTIAGYETTFIGANTPETTVLKAIQTIIPIYICISVTNHFNLVATKKTIEKIRETFNFDSKFLLGGSAFSSDPNMYKKVGGDNILKSFQDILNLDKGVENN